jgi:hypothetical protein
VYGLSVECLHPQGAILYFISYQCGVIFGALGYSYFYPYRALIGCSSGVYGLLGSCLALLILNYDSIDITLFYTLSGVIFVHIFFDVLGYFIWYDENIGYSAHGSGFIIGVLVGLFFGFFRKTNVTRQFIIPSFSLAGIIVFAYLVIHSYIVSWPPFGSSWDPTIDHSYEPLNCCGMMYSMLDSSTSKADIQSAYYCSDGELYEK